MPTGTVIGIDLGTTNSCVGVWKNNAVHIVKNSSGSRFTPSQVCFNTRDSTFHVGTKAMSSKMSNSANTIYDMKRAIGKPFNDPELQGQKRYWPFKLIADENGLPLVEVHTANGTLLQSPVDIAAKILAEMKRTAEKSLDKPVTKAVITVPAHFNQAKKDATMEAANQAGFESVVLITEPAAAAFAYHLDNPGLYGYKLLVFDLGGGTFDATIVEVNAGEFETIGIVGDSNLGGRDFDDKLFDYCKEKIRQQFNKEIRGKKVQTLRTACEEMKVALSTSTSYGLCLATLFGDLEGMLHVSRTEFENICAELIDKTIRITNELLKEVNLKPSDIDEILLVGGSSRIPAIQARLSTLFAGKKLNKSIPADEAVAWGATLRATQLCEECKHQLPKVNIVEATPLSLGTDNIGELFMPMIERNSRIPKTVSKSFCTTENDQQSMTFKIYEGVRKLVADNTYLNEFTIHDLTPGKIGTVFVDLTMKLDANGILHVSAHHKDIAAKMDIRYNKENATRVAGEKLRDSQRFNESDKENEARISARQELEEAMEKIGYEIVHSFLMDTKMRTERKRIIEELEEWLRNNPMASALECKKKMTLFNHSCWSSSRKRRSQYES